MIGRTLLVHAGGLPIWKEMARRLVFNVLMGNGDAHIKNWALIYDNPLLSLLGAGGSGVDRGYTTTISLWL